MSPLLLLLLLLHLPLALPDTQHVVFTFEYVNGTLVPVPSNANSNSDSSSSGVSGQIIQAAFFGLLFLLGFICSVLLIATVLSSLSLKRLPFNLLLMHLGITCLMECVLNVIVSMLYVIKVQVWGADFWVCFVNSFFMEVMPVLYTLLLLVLTVDRLMAFRDPVRYRKSVGASRHKILLVLCWLVAVGSAVVLAVGELDSWPFPVRYSCQLMDENSIYYALTTGLACYVLPWVAMAVCLGIILRMLSSERRREAKTGKGKTGNRHGGRVSDHTAFVFANVSLWNEVRGLMVVVVLVAMYAFLVVPYVVRIRVDQVERDYDYSYYENLTLPHWERIFINSTSSSTTKSPSASSPSPTLAPYREQMVVPNKIPEVTETFLDSVDSVLVWMRYIHFALVPLVVLVLHKDLRRKCVDLLCCFCAESRAEEEAATVRPISAYLRRIREDKRKEKKRVKHITSYRVPVLISTYDGLYLCMVDSNHSSANANNSTLNPRKKTAGNKKSNTNKNEFVMEFMEFCDLKVFPSSASSADSDAFGSAVTMLSDLKEEEEEGSDNRRVKFDSRIQEVPRGWEEESVKKRKKEKKRGGGSAKDGKKAKSDYEKEARKSSL